MSATLAARLVVLLPALSALVGLLLVRRSRAAANAVAVGGSVLTLAVALLGLGDTVRGVTMFTRLTAPLEAGELEVPLGLHTAPTIAVIAAVVALVSTAVQVYAAWYLRDDDRYDIFAATVSIFAAAMLLVVHSADLLLTLVGWEVMGWCSYLLIGHWSRKATARAAATKAFLVTRFADIGFVLGVVILAGGAGSTAYEEVVAYWTGALPCVDSGAVACAAPSPLLRNVALVLLVIGVLGKSAQFPFQDWLPDAMEGPTPASALIHAATMVAAGTFVLARLMPLLVQAEAARWVLAVSVAVSMVGAGFLAFGQSDIKRVLAWSTVSQIAVMLSPLAVAEPAEAAGASVLHLYSHAFFKALLFLAVGWSGLMVGGTAAERLRGSAAPHQVLQLAWGFGLLALVGFPITVGGISKEKVIHAARSAADHGEVRGLMVYVALLVTVVLTAAYATRTFMVLGAGADAERRGGHLVKAYLGQQGDAPHVEPVRPPAGVLLVFGTLVGLTVLGGWVVVSGLISVPGGLDIALTALTLGLILLGAALAFVLARGAHDPAVRVLGERMRWFDSGFGAARLYRPLVIVPVVGLARLVAFVDTEVVDAYVRGGAAAARLAGRAGDRVHRPERSATGLVWVLLGVAVLALVAFLSLLAAGVSGWT